MNEKGEQIAALPIKWDKSGKITVLMVTSRETRRWVLPKGWIMDNKKPWDAAKIEALEEAGADGCIADEELGAYHYDKVLDDGSTLRCRVTVYPMKVRKLKRNWKERDQRKRHWFTPKAAAKRVHEPELSALLLRLDKKPHKEPSVRMVREAS